MKTPVAAIKAREGEIVFDCDKYTIKRIPLNYQISYKVLHPSKTDKNGNRTRLIPDPHYNSLNFWPDVEDAKKLAEFMIEKHTRIALSSK